LFSLLTSQSLQDLKKIQSEYEKFKKQERSLSTLPFEENDIENPNNDLPKKVNLVSPLTNDIHTDSSGQKLRHFGYSFFSSRDSIYFWENLPEPRDYLLGPGDELIISIWGETQLRQKYTISRKGTIYDEKVGLLSLSGKTVEQSEVYLNKQFSRVYSTLNKPKPSSYIDISIGKPKSINVNFSGEVFLPGIHIIHPFSNIFTGLIQAGGVDTTGTLRNIILRRDGREYAEFDFYDYIVYGKIPKNIQLRDQDMVFVPIRNSSITIDSAVVKPAIYESKGRESIKKMIEYAGGAKPNASKSISLERVLPIEKRTGKAYSNYENYYLEYQESDDTFVQDGDLITLRRVPKTIKKVEILGLNPKPTSYHFYEGMKVKDLINISGVFDDSLSWNSYLNKSEIIRKDPGGHYEKVISINLFEVIRNNYDLKLENLDQLVLHKNPYYEKRQNVIIQGQVNIPGSYPLIKDREPLKSLINRSGGFTSKALEEGIIIFRTKKYYKQEIISELPVRPMQNLSTGVDQNSDEEYYEYLNEKLKKDKDRIRVAWTNYNIPLMPGDSIIVKEATETVLVDGEVYNPGLIEFRKDKNLQYYIDSAGGININGDKKNIIVVYANGVIKPKKSFLSPRIKDGATIYINKKEIKAGMDLTDISTFFSIISTAITSYVLIQQVTQN
tara:strand:- start:3636 stop:5645 length:2010 start_codon:yes stop_codon:yes gene_type:complete